MGYQIWKYLRSAAVWLLLTAVLFVLLLVFFLSDTGDRIRLAVILLLGVCVSVSFRRHRRQSSARAYEAFLTLRQDSVEYGCAVARQRSLFEPEQADCPLHDLKWRPMHGDAELSSAEDLFLVLELTEGAPRLRVDLVRAFLSAKGNPFKGLPDRLRFDFRPQAGGDTVTVKRTSALLECDKLYDITYRHHQLHLLVYRDSSKGTLLSNLTELYR